MLVYWTKSQSISTSTSLFNLRDLGPLSLLGINPSLLLYCCDNLTEPLRMKFVYECFGKYLWDCEVINNVVHMLLPQRNLYWFSNVRRDCTESNQKRKVSRVIFYFLLQAKQKNKTKETINNPYWILLDVANNMIFSWPLVWIRIFPKALIFGH